MLFSTVPALAQKPSYQNLLDVACIPRGTFVVLSKPITIRELNANETEQYVQTMREYSGLMPDTVRLKQVFHNLKTQDSLAWQDDELPGLILVEGRQQTITIRKAIAKFNREARLATSSFRRYFRRYNRTEPASRLILYFSRPVFDNTGTYAIVEWGYGAGSMAGGGGIKLFEWKAATGWKEAGVIERWEY